MKNKIASICLMCLCISIAVQAQNDPEFPKGFIMHLNWQQGLQTNFSNTPDLYVTALQAIPQFTVLPGRLRMGAAVGFYYTKKQMLLSAGPLVTYKLKTFNAGQFGSLANVNLRVEHLWLPKQNYLAGAGLQLDLLNKIVVGVMAHRAYKINEWWFQLVLGYRISRLKKVIEPFNQ